MNEKVPDWSERIRPLISLGPGPIMNEAKGSRIPSGARFNSGLSPTENFRRRPFFILCESKLLSPLLGKNPFVIPLSDFGKGSSVVVVFHSPLPPFQKQQQLSPDPFVCLDSSHSPSSRPPSPSVLSFHRHMFDFPISEPRPLTA